ncbi:MAG: flagellar type III secretion system pore protein FliP [Candidatus Cloacimonadota bacterium]|nr:flagellar type III secretion system pore protein FliP [Candidatus Cloacimonadota bacterium]
MKKITVFSLLLIMLVAPLVAAPIPGVSLDLATSDSPENVAVSLKILGLLTVLTLIPSILIMMTSFTRLIIVFQFVKRALGLNQLPSQILIGLSLFLTFFIMSPVLSNINKNALQPYMEKKITQKEALKVAETGIKNFMYKQTRQKDIQLFIKHYQMPKPETREDLPLTIMIPAFMISELRIAFQIGFILYLPFLMIDIIVSSVLLSMGMMMLPPMMISLPMKVLVFVLADGWYLLVGSLMSGFK